MIGVTGINIIQMSDHSRDFKFYAAMYKRTSFQEPRLQFEYNCQMNMQTSLCNADSVSFIFWSLGRESGYKKKFKEFHS